MTSLASEQRPGPAASPGHFLDVRDLKVHFPTDDGLVRSVDGLSFHVERGKTLVIRFLAVGEADEEGRRTIFFELNGQPREVKVADRSLATSAPSRRMADDGDPAHSGDSVLRGPTGST